MEFLGKDKTAMMRRTHLQLDQNVQRGQTWTNFDVQEGVRNG